MSTSYSRSDQIGKLVTALAKARKNFAPVTKSCENPYYGSKYADLAALIAASAEALSDNELVVLQPARTIVNGNYQVEVETLLVHSSGEWISSTLAVPIGKPDAQGIGSAMTYARRYAYGALLSIASEEDDDGNAAVGKHRDQGKSTDDKGETLNPVQLKAFHAACKKAGRTDKQIAEYLELIGIGSIEELPQSELSNAIAFAQGRYMKGSLEEDLKASVKVAGKQSRKDATAQESRPAGGSAEAPPEPHYEPVEEVSRG